MNVYIKVIPNKEQRYPTCGDWLYLPDGSLEIRVSKMSDWRYEMLVAVHELVEVLLCKVSGVTQESVDAFDIAFEKQRKNSLTLDTREPGDEPDAPYHVPHCLATGVERIMAAFMGVNWSLYEREINSL